eukprot:12156284-Prorocentrum_lima.AAC.1
MRRWCRITGALGYPELSGTTSPGNRSRSSTSCTRLQAKGRSSLHSKGYTSSTLTTHGRGERNQNVPFGSK